MCWVCGHGGSGAVFKVFRQKYMVIIKLESNVFDGDMWKLVKEISEKWIGINVEVNKKTL